MQKQFVQFLQEELQVPIEMIELEVPVSYFLENARGRLDKFVYCQNEDQLLPVLIIELKSQNVQLTDEVYEQFF
ncbi:hypothetical protein YDYSG_03360 [Paenibacillus tyrfis]|uniref:type I restriction enzyme HsdR N-terminal domain-containing protein n=1 Tax=Paenibacillus tyrfis TaxID=1501230 RepID=UPI002492CDE7|nr:type I restriction enzyme HsdR N-terminal domain-containing protein [Paenibacillus tyrfis]GLI04306.1 hypothetical protein YDYSG_03360 [Paenibacillus tyrfis]